MSRREKLKATLARRTGGEGAQSYQSRILGKAPAPVQTGVKFQFSQKGVPKSQTLPPLPDDGDDDGEEDKEKVNAAGQYGSQLFTHISAEKKGAHAVWFICANVFMAVQCLIRYLDATLMVGCEESFAPRRDDDPATMKRWFQWQMGVVQEITCQMESIFHKCRKARRLMMILRAGEAASWMDYVCDWAEDIVADFAEFIVSSEFATLDYGLRAENHSDLIAYYKKIQAIFALVNTPEHSPVKLPPEHCSEWSGTRTLVACTVQTLTEENRVSRNFIGVYHDFPNLTFAISDGKETQVTICTSTSGKARQVFFPIFSFKNSEITALYAPFLLNPKEIIAASIGVTASRAAAFVATSFYAYGKKKAEEEEKEKKTQKKK